jgi:cytochrome c553
MSRTTRRNIIWGSVPMLAMIAAYIFTAQSGATADTARAKRGEYLVNTAGCHDCHTPWKMGANGPEPDMSRMLSGHPETLQLTPPPALTGTWAMVSSFTNTAHSGAWGISYTMNLTPDRNNGLGIWTEEMFLKAIRTGRHMGVSRPINPPMPWQVYRNFSDDDLKAIYAYLRTIPPIVNHIPDYVPPAEVKTEN